MKDSEENIHAVIGQKGLTHNRLRGLQKQHNVPIVNPCFFWGDESFNTLHLSSTIAPTGSEFCIHSATLKEKS